MTLDDRLRDAYRRNLDDVRNRVDGAVFEPDPTPVLGPAGGSPLLRMGGLAAAAAVVLVVGVGLYRLVSDGSAGVVETEAADDGGARSDDGNPDPVGDAPPSDDADDGREPSTVVVAPDPTDTDDSDGRSDDHEADDDGSTGEGEASPTTEPPAEEPATSPSTEANLDRGVATPVCPTGLRAELELAELSYVGPNEGWGRKDDLVDEQDGPFFFEAWEPNHERPVTVEVVLDRPVTATDFRVHQDPFTPVSGVITVEAGGREFGIELSGTDGWRVHRFEQPVTIDRFTIRRDGPEANIMEVMICVEPTTEP